jgi:HEAT repeat protein
VNVGFLDFLTGSPLKRNLKKAVDRDAQADDRESALHALAAEGSREALEGLCARFALQLEHGMRDRKEKDLVFDLLCDKGATGAEVARAYARATASFAWPVRVVERVEGAAEATSLLLGMLAEESVDNELKPEKKHHLLIALAERKDARIVESAAPFLADFNEGVRNAAMEAVAAQDGDAGIAPLTAALVSPTEESTRIRGRLAEIFAARDWPAPQDAWFLGNLPVGYHINEGRLVRR